MGLRQLNRRGAGCELGADAERRTVVSCHSGAPPSLWCAKPSTGSSRTAQCDHWLVMHRLGLTTIIALVLSASCTLPRPDVGLTISGTPIPASREGSYCQSGGCSGVCADGPAPAAPLTRVRATTPIRLDFVASGEVNQIHGDIWQGETMGDRPIESFTLESGARSYTTSQLKSGGRYYIAVLIGWSRFVDRGDTSRAFLIDLASP